MATNTIVVNVLGNVRGLTSSLAKAQKSLTALQGNLGGLNKGMRALAVTGAAAGAAMGGVMAAGAGTAAVALGSVAGAAAGLAAIPALFAKIGLAAYTGTKAGADAMKALKSETAAVFQEASKPFQLSITDTFASLQEIIKNLGPSLGRIYEQLAGVLDGVNERLVGLSTSIGPALEKAFSAGLPAFQAVIDGLFKIGGGLMDAINILHPAREGFGNFITVVMDGIAAMIPTFAKLAVAMLPLATTMASHVAPAFASVVGFITNELLPLVDQLGPAFNKAFGFIGDIFFGIGQSLPAIVDGINGFWDAMSGVGGAGGQTETLFRTLGETLGGLLPMFGELLAAIVPIATQFLEVFGPAIEQFGGIVISTLLPAISGLLDFLADHESLATALVIAWTAWSAAGSVLGPILIGLTRAQGLFNTALTVLKAVGPVVMTVIRGIGMAFTFLAANPIVLIVAAIVAVIAAIIYLWNNCEWFRDAVIAVWEWIKSATETVWNAIKDFFIATWDFIKGVFQGFIDFVVFLWENFTVPGLIMKHWDTIKNATKAVWEWITNLLSTVWNWIKDTATTVFNAIKDYFVGVFNFYKDLITTVWNAIKGFLEGIWNGLKNVATTVWNAIKSAIDTAINAVKTVITNVLNTVKGIWESIWNGVSNFVSTIWEGIKSAVTTAINSVRDIVGGIKDKILGVFTAAGSWLLSAGKDIVEGLWNGIKNMGTWLKDKVTGFVNNMVDNVLGFLGINSPSKVFMEIGDYVAQGLARGITKNKEAFRAAEALAKGVVKSFGEPELEFKTSLKNSPARGSASPGAGGNGGEVVIDVGGIHFNGLVTDPVAAGKEVEKVLSKYISAGGRVRFA